MVPTLAVRRGSARWSSASCASVPELARLRLSSIDSVEADADLFDALANEPRLMPHLHLSLQAGDDLILKRMKRRHARADAIAFCDQVRRLRPDVAFGADIIAGFPTETEDMFSRSLDLVDECGLTTLHVFPFSARPGTPAARMPQVDRAVAKERARRLREKGEAALRNHLTNEIGATRRVLAESPALARTEQFTPVRLAAPAVPGEILDLTIADHDGRQSAGCIIKLEEETMSAGNHQVTTLEQLEALYGERKPTTIRKEVNRLSAGYRKLIEAAPFVVVATAGPEGLDCSPKGDPAGFVHILDDRTLAIPDRPGNNRLDGYRNIVRDPRVSLLFLIPGVGESLRVNGRGSISVDPDLMQGFAINGKLPRSVLIVHIDSVFFHCAKAAVRAKLWDEASRVDRKSLPSTGRCSPNSPPASSAASLTTVRCPSASRRSSTSRPPVVAAQAGIQPTDVVSMP